MPTVLSSAVLLNRSYCVHEAYDVLSPCQQYDKLSSKRTVMEIRGSVLQLTLEVYEGENETASANTLLDSFNLTGLPRLPLGEADVLVKFRVEFDGTLTVTAQDRSRGGILPSLTDQHGFLNLYKACKSSKSKYGPTLFSV